MAEIQLVAEPGRPEGSSASRRLRRDGKIPAVVYGHGIEPIAVSVDAREVRVALNGEAGSRALLELHVGGETHLAVARQLQRHPVRHTVTHIDFQVVSRDEIISADVPITLVGESESVRIAGGSVDQEMMTLSVKGRPGQLPPHLEIDVTALEVGQAIRVGDVTLPDGVETDVDPEVTIATAQARHVAGGGAEEAAAESAGGQAAEAEAAGDTGAGES